MHQFPRVLLLRRITMKTKLFNKKLNLTKHTVAHLDNREQADVKGGVISARQCLFTIELTCTCNTDCGCVTDCTSVDACSC